MVDKLTMFLSDLTVVDHAYIDDNGKIIGGSFNPGFLVTGEIDPVENVIVDFSTIKKSIKGKIDDPISGFDHKLWIIEGYSQCNYSFNEDRAHIDSQAIELDIPKDAVKIFSAKEYSIIEMGLAFANYLNDVLKAHHPGVKVRCFNNTKPHQLNIQNHPTSYFTYCHGLKNSTSRGCQNNSHGHLSFVALFPDEDINHSCDNKKILQLQNDIAQELDATIFVWKENITKQEQNWIYMEYCSRDRGYFSAKYNTQQQKVVVLDNETTVEFLIEYVSNKWYKQLSDVEADVMMLSEGLTKGAYVDLSERQEL